MRSPGLTAIACLLATPAIAGQQPAPSAAPGTSFCECRECRECPEMKVLPAGSFTMGSPKNEAERFDNEGPQHPVTIAQPFAIGVYDVTVGEYRTFVRAIGRKTNDECRIYDPAFVDPQLVRVRGKNWEQPNFAQTVNPGGLRYLRRRQGVYRLAERQGRWRLGRDRTLQAADRSRVGICRASGTATPF